MDGSIRRAVVCGRTPDLHIDLHDREGVERGLEKRESPFPVAAALFFSHW